MEILEQLVARDIVAVKVIGSNPIYLPNYFVMTEQEKTRKEICERWASFGLTEGLQGKSIETIVKLFESETKQLTEEAKEKLEFNEVNFPILTKVLGKTLYGAEPTPMK